MKFQISQPLYLITMCIVTTLLLPRPAAGSILNLTASGDGYIRASQEAGDTKNTTNVNFLVGNTSPTDELRGFIQFDLSNPVLTGATINSASLSLEVYSKDTSSVNETVSLNLFQITGALTEGSATWFSRDGTTNWTAAGGDFSSPALTSTTANASTVFDGYKITFTGGTLGASVQSSIGNTLNLLTSIGSVDGTRSIFRFVSDDVTHDFPSSTQMIPTLTLDYSAIPEPSSFALLALALVAIPCFIHRRK